jgi:hypothetical protein
MGKPLTMNVVVWESGARFGPRVVGGPGGDLLACNKDGAAQE